MTILVKQNQLNLRRGQRPLTTARFLLWTSRTNFPLNGNNSGLIVCSQLYHIL